MSNPLVDINPSDKVIYHTEVFDSPGGILLSVSIGSAIFAGTIGTLGLIFHHYGLFQASLIGSMTSKGGWTLIGIGAGFSALAAVDGVLLARQHSKIKKEMEKHKESQRSYVWSKTGPMVHVFKTEKAYQRHAAGFFDGRKLARMTTEGYNDPDYDENKPIEKDETGQPLLPKATPPFPIPKKTA